MQRNYQQTIRKSIKPDSIAVDRKKVQKIGENRASIHLKTSVSLKDSIKDSGSLKNSD
jgi:hypothetical protein